MTDTLLIWASLLKIFIDIFAPLLPEQARSYIPLFAIILGLSWTFAFGESDTVMTIYEWVWLGLGAVWINEWTNAIKKAVEKKPVVEETTVPANLGERGQIN